MSAQFNISITHSRKIAAPSWTDAELEAQIWATDEKATGWGVSIEEETEP